MKTFVHSDSEGTIRAIVSVDAADNIRAGLDPEPGELVSEVEQLDVDLTNLGELDWEAIDGIAEQYKVEPHTPRPAKLVER
jgi:hypothetical protein